MTTKQRETATNRDPQYASISAGAAKTIVLRTLPTVAVFLAFVAVWQCVVWVWQLPPILLPGPASVLQAARENYQILQSAAWSTTQAALAGLSLSILFGSFTAIFLSQSRVVRTAFYPYVMFLQTVPIVAIAPLLITWFGYEFRSIVLVAMIISLFPIISNVTSGLLSLDRNLQELFSLYHANRWKTLLKLRIPSAIPHLVLGARISSGLAVIGAIMGEFFVGNGTSYDGLGTLMTLWMNRQRTSALIAAVFVSTLLGLGMLGLVNLISATVLRKWTRAAHFERED